MNPSGSFMTRETFTTAEISTKIVVGNWLSLCFIFS
jgi:hypothetical protein